MAGFMDYFTGGAGGTGFDMFGAEASGMNDLLTAQQQEAIKRQSMLAMAAQLLQAGGPSSQRIGLGQALGQGVMAGQQAQEKGTTGAVNQMLLRQKLDEAKRAQALQGQIQSVFAGGMPTQQDAALAAPESVAGAPGPTLRRAELGLTPTTTVNPRAAQAERYRQAAALSAGDPTKSKAYMDIAEMLEPRAEVTGQPFKLTDASGNDIMVQQMKSGEIRTMPGYGVPREVVLQNLGGQTVAIDKSKLTSGQTFQQTMTPAEAASNLIAQGNLNVAQGGLNLRRQEFNRGAFDRVETPEGFVNIPKAGGPAVPIMGPGGTQLKGTSGGSLTEGERKAATLLSRLQIADAQIAKQTGQTEPGPFSSATPRVMKPQERKRVEDAELEFLDAALTLSTGAAYTKEQLQGALQSYFPQYGDDELTIAEKTARRLNLTDSAKLAAGKAAALVPGTSPYLNRPPVQPTGGRLHPTDVQRIIDSFNQNRSR